MPDMNENKVKCQNCGQLIRSEAQFCLYCGEKQVPPVEEQVAGIRKAFFMDYMQRQKSGRAKPARQLIDAYAKSIGFTGKYPRKGPLGGDPATGHTKFGDTAFWNAMLVVNTPGFNTAGDMFRFHQFITRPENDDRDARQVARAGEGAKVIPLAARTGKK